jgi:hypothetical protein
MEAVERKFAQMKKASCFRGADPRQSSDRHKLPGQAFSPIKKFEKKVCLRQLI